MKILLMGVRRRSLIDFRGSLIRDMVAAGHTVVGCTPGEDPIVENILAGWRVAYCSIDLDRTGLNPFKELRSLITIVKLFRRLRPDVVLSYSVKPNIYGALAARITGVSKAFQMIEGLGYAFTNEDSFRRSILRRLLILLLRFSLKDLSGIFVLNPDDRADLVTLKIVENERILISIDGIGIDLNDFPLRAIVPGALSFLLVARLTYDKGILDYVEAARKLKPRYPRVRFCLLGPLDSGPARVAESEIGAWQHEGVIEYLGVTNDVRPFLQDSTVFVLPSFYREGLPRSILEAMATGRAVVTTDVPGCRETMVPERMASWCPRAHLQPWQKRWSDSFVTRIWRSRWADAAARLLRTDSTLGRSTRSCCELWA